MAKTEKSTSTEKDYMFYTAAWHSQFKLSKLSKKQTKTKKPKSVLAYIK